jgi:hypothetical protein
MGLDIGLGKIKPSAPADDALLRKADEVGERNGFVSRVPEVAKKRQRGTSRDVHQFTMRVCIGDSNRFLEWCEARRLSYREGFQILVDLLDRA